MAIKGTTGGSAETSALSRPEPAISTRKSLADWINHWFEAFSQFN